MRDSKSEVEELRERLRAAEARAAAASAASEQYFRRLLESTADMVLVTAEGQVVYVSTAVRAILGYEPDEVIGRTAASLIHPDDLPLVRDTAGKLITRPGGTVENMVRAIHKDGSVRWLEGTSRNLLDDPMVKGIVGAYRDVTQRQLEREELRVSEARYRRIVETTMEGVWVIDADSRTVFVNEHLAQMFGFTVGEMVGRPMFDFMDDEARAIAARNVERRRSGIVERHEFRFVRRDGSPLWVEMETGPMMDDQGRYEGALAMVTDTTERRKIEQAREQLAAIVASSSDAILHTTLDGSILSWNAGAEHLLGWKAEEIIGKNVLVLEPPELQGAIGTIASTVLRGVELEQDETTRIRKDGTAVEVSIKFSPLRDARGDVVGISAIARDITQRKRAERAEQTLQETEEQLRQAQKLEALGRLAGGVAHDFNNILSVILGYTSILLADFGTDEPLHHEITEIHEAGLRARDLTRQLLAFSRQQVLRPQVLDVNVVLSRLETMLHRLLGEDVELVIFPGRGLSAIKCDPSQTEQIILNLAVNARDAMPSGGRLTIETANVMLDAASSHAVGIKPGPYVKITVSDTGIGMDEATRSRIFEPFFTTKEKGKGTGLGLAMVFGVVKQSGGHVWVDTAPGRGATFRIVLPRSDEPLSMMENLLGATSLPRGTETVLLVEDDDPVRLLARNILRRSGYRVLECSNAGEALLVCEKHRGPIHLLLTDVVMPRMGGHELALRIRAVRPDTRVLYMSGYTDDTVLFHGIRLGQLSFVGKPLTVESLARKVRETLDAPLPDPLRTS